MTLLRMCDHSRIALLDGLPCVLDMLPTQSVRELSRVSPQIPPRGPRGLRRRIALLGRPRIPSSTMAIVPAAVSSIHSTGLPIMQPRPRPMLTVIGRSSSSANNRTQVPYFRYFGPTAIVPGFKQMVRMRLGELRRSDVDLCRSWRFEAPAGVTLHQQVCQCLYQCHIPYLRQLLTKPESSPTRSPKPVEIGMNLMSAFTDSNRDGNTIVFYDTEDNVPTSDLVTHLCELFFERLGCNFPFLQRKRFLRDLKDKKANTMLVNAVCALSARFSLHPELSHGPSSTTSTSAHDARTSDCGQPFARKAMSALVDSLSCPTLAVAQACLLLAYEEFGSNRDSGLWMYLGISIRMAQDLGMQKRRGPKYSRGPSDPPSTSVSEEPDNDPCEDHSLSLEEADGDVQDIEDCRARKREREDTFWCIFFLDRVISSGTGRPVTLRDEEIELSFPPQLESVVASDGRPAPFPPLIRIVHLYGRVTDIINGIQDANDVTEDTVKRLASLESDLTGIYSALSSKLYFDATNLQEYVMAKEGTSFILLHLWFHALIVLLHQPTLLHSFGGTIQQLYPNSRTLAMSSAKTIADIYSFSELLDNKSFSGNPFTTQPMYIAACAFLMESAYYASPNSRSGVSPQPLLANQSSGFVMPDVGLPHGSEHKSIGAAQHTLLANIAKDNYQRCYKALKAIETYWDGTKYILTVLDQKAKGIVDPLLYTAEEVANTPHLFPAHVKTSGPGGGRQTNSPSRTTLDRPEHTGYTNSPGGRRLHRPDAGQAIGWALTNAANHHNPNLSVLYQNPSASAHATTKPVHSSYSHGYNAPAQTQQPQPTQTQTQPVPVSGSFPVEHARRTEAIRNPAIPSTTAPAAPGNLVMGLNAPYSSPNPRHGHSSSPFAHGPGTGHGAGTSFPYQIPPAANPQTSGGQLGNGNGGRTEDQPMVGSCAGDVLIESQNIDMDMLQHPEQLPFGFNGETLPWLEYLPPDVTNLLGEHHDL